MKRVPHAINTTEQKMQTQITQEVAVPTWITDHNGNRASIAKWGSEEAAKASLKTLRDCSNCWDCSNCRNCSNCWDCQNCQNCASCTKCSGKTNTRHGDGFEFFIPKIENIHSRIYEAVSQPEALNMGTWHTCETTHCRAGWAVHLAGEAGKKLETQFNTELAAMLIYRESGSPINPARFYDSNEDALADMKRLSDLEAVQS